MCLWQIPNCYITILAFGTRCHNQNKERALEFARFPRNNSDCRKISTIVFVFCPDVAAGPAYSVTNIIGEIYLKKEQEIVNKFL
jgi:hypothetical protein